MSYVDALVCKGCGKSFNPREMRYSCDSCGSFLEVRYRLDKMKEQLDRDKISERRCDIMTKWQECLPIEDPALIKKVSLGETESPLIESNRFHEGLAVKKVYLKNDYLFPTLSLKDRSIPLTVLKGLEMNQGSPSIVSSGNAAASLSAYASRAGKQAVIFVGKNARGPRLEQILMTGALAVLVNGDYSTAEALFIQARAKFGWYDCNGQVNPFRLEGKRTYAHEICMQLGWEPPSLLLMPIAGGNGVIAVEKGLQELKELGWIDCLPRIYGVQAKNCAPIAQAFEQGWQEVRPVTPAATAAGSIATADPGIGGNLTLAAVRRTGGGIVSVPEEKILQTQRELARSEGIYCEPAGCISAAALSILCEQGIIKKDDTAVCVLTAHGLKQNVGNTQPTGVLLEVEPSLEALAQALEASGVL